MVSLCSPGWPEVYHVVLGWPRTLHDPPASVSQYWNLRLHLEVILETNGGPGKEGTHPSHTEDQAIDPKSSTSLSATGLCPNISLPLVYVIWLP